jgi:hypothetical protein
MEAWIPAIAGMTKEIGITGKGVLLAIGYWLLAIGYWLLAIGYWLLPNYLRCMPNR